jgi:hypothetical protein
MAKIMYINDIWQVCREHSSFRISFEELNKFYFFLILEIVNTKQKDCKVVITSITKNYPKTNSAFQYSIVMNDFPRDPALTTPHTFDHILNGKP